MIFPENKPAYTAPALKLCKLKLDSHILQSSISSDSEDALDGIYL